MNTADKLRVGREEKKTASSVRFIGFLLLLIIVITAFLFVNSPYFAVGGVNVEGNRYLTQEEIYRIAGVPSHVNIFRLNITDIKNRLTSDLRIADVKVVRQLPATIVIAISERRPVAFLASSFGFVEVDKQGVILAVHRNIKQSHVPMITGFRTGNAYVGDKIEESQSAKQVLRFLALLEETTVNQLSEINITSDRLTAYTTNAVNIRLGSIERIDDKAQLLNNILAEINSKKLNIEYIDLTYGSPFIKVRQ